MTPDPRPPQEALAQVIAAMREFERSKPNAGGQQTRTKTAREMVGEFAYQLDAALARVEQETAPRAGYAQNCKNCGWPESLHDNRKDSDTCVCMHFTPYDVGGTPQEARCTVELIGDGGRCLLPVGHKGPHKHEAAGFAAPQEARLDLEPIKARLALSGRETLQRDVKKLIAELERLRASPGAGEARLRDLGVLLRPWIDGKTTWEEWLAALDRIEALLVRDGRGICDA